MLLSSHASQGASLVYSSFSGYYLCPQPTLKNPAPMRLVQGKKGRLGGGAAGLYEIQKGVAVGDTALVTLWVLALNPHVQPGDYVVAQDIAVVQTSTGLHFEGRGFRMDCRRTSKSQYDKIMRWYQPLLANAQVSDCAVLVDLISRAQAARRKAGQPPAGSVKDLLPMNPPVSPRLIRAGEDRFFCSDVLVRTSGDGFSVQARPLGELSRTCTLSLKSGQKKVQQAGKCVM